MADNQAEISKIQDSKGEGVEKKGQSDEAKEKMYQRMLELDKSVACIEQYELFVFVYKEIIQKAKKLGTYKDADTYRKKYEKELETLQIESREKIYQHALELKENAKKAEDLQWIRKEIHRIPGYKDVEAIGEWCDSIQDDMEKREKRNAWIRLVVIILVVLVIVFVGKYLYESFM